MAGLEKRDRLADHEPSIDVYGECFIAVHMMDGSEETISGIADTVKIRRHRDDYLSWSGRVDGRLNGWDVTVHFNSDLIREVKSMHGEATYE